MSTDSSLVKVPANLRMANLSADVAGADNDSLVTKISGRAKDYYSQLQKCSPALYYVIATLALWAYYLVTDKAHRTIRSIIISLVTIFITSLILLYVCDYSENIVWVVFAVQFIFVLSIFWKAVPASVRGDEDEEGFCANCL